MVKPSVYPDVVPGACCAVPARHFGEEWAKKTFGSNWNTTKIRGNIVSLHVRNKVEVCKIDFEDGVQRTFERQFVNEFIIRNPSTHDSNSNEGDVESDWEVSGGSKSGGNEKTKENIDSSDSEESQGEEIETALEALEPQGIIWDAGDQFVDPEISFNCLPGPRFRLDNFDSPVLLFIKLFPIELWDRIVRETNTYAHQKGAVNRRDGYRDVTREELLVFVSLNIAMTLNPKKQQRLHWSTEKRGAINGGAFGEFMSLTRYLDIKSFFHVNNNDDPTDGNDPLHKLRPVLDTLGGTFRSSYTLGQSISIDEAMIPYKGSRNPVRIYMPKKPHKWGAKLWTICDSDTSYGA